MLISPRFSFSLFFFLLLGIDSFRLECFSTLTGIKFMLVGDAEETRMKILLRKIYALYADYVLKNPFQILDMPIKCQLFDQHVLALVSAANTPRAQ